MVLLAECVVQDGHAGWSNGNPPGGFAVLHACSGGVWSRLRRRTEIPSRVGGAVIVAENWGRYMHPDTVSALESGRNLVHVIYDMLERIDGVRARRPSPSSRVIPEIDGMGRLTDLYIAPGTIASFVSGQELVDEIMAAIRDSTADALRQHEIVVQETVWPDVQPPRP